ncbi:MAG: hypothetical protein RLZZ297_1280 [Chloroflexota bacterium]|jgi:aminoglycoside 6'-N-acetyltransferase I
MSAIRLLDFAHDAAAHDGAAAVLVAAFAGISPAWPDHAAGSAAIATYLADDLLAYGAYVDDTLVAWIGALPQYDGHAWELHPLAVIPKFQRKGIGRSLIETLETALIGRGVSTIFVWSDDETGTTSLGGQSLYPEPLTVLPSLVSSPHHAGGFYRRCGYALAGVIPDANGCGKHDFLYTKRLIEP